MLVEKEVIFRNLVSIRSKIYSTFFMLLFIFEIYLIDGRDDINPFVMIFIGSITIYLIYLPWTKLKEITVSQSTLTQKERIGLGLRLKEFKVNIAEINNISLKNGIVKIKSDGKVSKIDLNSLMLLSEVDGAISKTINKKLTPEEAYEIIFEKY